MFSKYLFKLVITSFLVAAPVLVQAQDALKLGVVNISRLLQESPQAIAAGARIEDEFAPRQREIMALQSELEEKAARIQKDLEVMGAEERENAQRDLRNDEREIVRAQNEFREDLDLRRNEVIGAVQRDVLMAVKAYGDAEGFDLILAEGIVQFNTRIEVTDQVLERLLAQSATPAAAE
jgi:outer membrane protein